MARRFFPLRSLSPYSKAMKRLLPLALAMFAFGCHHDDAGADSATTTAPKSTPPKSTPPTKSTAAGGVAPIGSGAAGGLTPMTGSENVEGAGMGGLGNAAKDRARSVAGAAGGSSVGNGTGSDG